MFKRVRQLHISLAAKCQLLFGTAVALIIFAALFVPWQRIEQLTEQINERAASVVAETAVNDHVMRETLLATERNGLFTTVPATAPTTSPATSPTSAPSSLADAKTVAT